MSMKFKKLVSIAIMALFISSIILINSPQIKAQSEIVQPLNAIPAGITPDETVTPKAFLSYRPTTIGLGQAFLVNIWVTPAPGAGRYFKDYTVTITKPDGDQETFKMDSYVADGTQWFEYMADQVGEWKIKFEAPGTFMPAGRYSLTSGAYMATSSYTTYTASAYYAPASTDEYTLTVQENMVASYPAVQLPTDYWTRPVAIENREWWPILGDYPWRGPGGGAEWDARFAGSSIYWNGGQYFVPWVQGPESPHVVWKRTGAVGGLIGAGYPKENYIWPNVGSGLEPSIIFQGRAYQAVTKGQEQVLQCYDLRTGEIYWEQTDVPVPTTIEYSTGSQPVPGAIPKISTTGVSLIAISGSNLIKYNPFNGAITLNVSTSPLTSSTYYMNGFAYSVQNLGNNVPASERYRLINWTTIGTSTNFTTRIMNNISWPFSSLNAQTTDFGVGVAASISGITRSGAYVGQNITATSLKTGQVLWSVVNDEPVYSGSSNVADHGIVADLSAKGYYIGYDLLTGTKRWQTETMDYPWDAPGFGAYGVQSAYGLFYRNAYGGVYAFSWETGKIVWKFESIAESPFESDFTGRNGDSVYSFNAPALIADGKMYIYNAEHSPDSPNNRGWKTFALNATTGEQIWNVTIAGGGWFGATSAELAVADGYLSLGGNDGIQYIFGRGKSATTVTATETLDNKVLIQGTVLDISPAQPNTPAVSKESMATQMEYIHKQMPIGGVWGNETINGVPVTITAVDTSNGNILVVDTVTTNGYYGTFNLVWNPPHAGIYEIMASFTADDSYGSSSASTAISVSQAQEPSPTPSQQQTQQDNLPLFGCTIAIIAAIAIVALLLLRKKP